ncbi:MAG TPA: LOG family protein [Myxococcota bacterium]|nr:LOG family protein [Myxococcota bacterium]
MTQTPEKAYKNLSFLTSAPARTIRILCEYEEPRQRFQANGIRDTIVFFGSARAHPRDVAEQRLADARHRVAAHPDDPDAQHALRHAEAGLGMSTYYEQARELARRLAQWSVYRDSRHRYTICTGGGPGIMEAANRGASEVEGARSIGLGISLPFEPGVNEYVSRELGFEFHYFFMRKLWFVYLMKAMVVFPGGFGTLDELFESLTLMQTGKVKHEIPIVLFGTAYWERVIGLEAMAEFGTISQRDLSRLYRTDDVEDAFRYISHRLEEIESRPHPANDRLP